MSEPDNHTLALLQTMREEMTDRFNRLDEKIEDIAAKLEELRRQTQIAMHALTVSHDRRLQRTEQDITEQEINAIIRKRLRMVRG